MASRIMVGAIADRARSRDTRRSDDHNIIMTDRVGGGGSRAFNLHACAARRRRREQWIERARVTEWHAKFAPSDDVVFLSKYDVTL